MADRSYKLAHYQITEKDNGELWWRSHGGFASVKTGKCFIEGDILFIGQTEEEDHGQLKNEFLNILSKLPKWTRTKYYCPRYTLHQCGTEKL